MDKWVPLVFFALLCLGVHGLVWRSESVHAFPAKYKETTLDHFNPQDKTTFKQKWYMNDLYWDKTGPVILYINGEGPVSGPPYLDDDELVILAKEHKALLVTVEHRYFGESTPFTDVAVKNLRFLSTSQALHDLADFVQYIKTNVLTSGSKNKWLHAGGSYSGALSAWFSIKFPHLSDWGAIASSAVVNVIEDFYQFEEQWAKSVGPTCANQVRKITKLIEESWDKDPAYTRAMFNASTLIIPFDFHKYIADTWIESVQYGYQPEICSAVNVADDQLLKAYSTYLAEFFLPTFQMDPNTYSTAWQSKTNYEAEGSRSWWYMKCSELAWFQTPSPTNPIRSQIMNLTSFREHCKQVFGIDLYPNVAETNLNYGGVVPAGHKIVFAEGSQDPWQAASVQGGLPHDEPKVVITCERCGHCVDLRGCPPNGACPGGVLQEGREKIAMFLRQWLSE